MVLVSDYLEVLEDVVEERLGPASQVEPRIRVWAALEESLHLLPVVVVDVAVSARPDELADLQVALLREQVGEQRVARDVERDAEEDVGG